MMKLSPWEVKVAFQNIRFTFRPPYGDVVIDIPIWKYIWGWRPILAPLRCEGLVWDGGLFFRYIVRYPIQITFGNGRRLVLVGETVKEIE